jgi:hypothetical protein
MHKSLYITKSKHTCLCSASDPEIVKMLKRELAIAISEEDYAQAAQLRDSPLMRLYMKVKKLKAAGDLAAALELQDEFDAAAAKWDFGSSSVNDS